jgi:4,5:9,10-diseco-3-hydroxy-5,9,17-trioxoandrosta-1(10),2-diene-4-oate hydrolase
MSMTLAAATSPARVVPLDAGDARRSLRRHAVGASDARRFVIVDGVRLAYDDVGTGSTVVCLHAIGHGAGDFARLAARLSDHHRVLALDWPGQGWSDPDREPPSSRRYAELGAGFLAAVDAGPVVIVGNSIGGGVAIRHAAAHPGQVRGLVLANPSGLDAFDVVTRVACAAMAGFFRAGMRRAWWFRRAFAAYYHMVLPLPAAAAQRARIVAAADEIVPVLAEAWAGFASSDADLRALAPTISCPVLFTWAVRDRFVQLRRNLPAIRTFPNARVVELSAGHAPQLETPDAFEVEVSTFLASLPGGAAPSAPPSRWDQSCGDGCG